MHGRKPVPGNPRQEPAEPSHRQVALNAGSDQEFYGSYFPTAKLLASIYGNTENMEGITAFLEKRKPDFRKYRVRRTKV